LECPNTPECNIITCTKCSESYCSTHKTHECENTSSGDHGTGICAKCWVEDPDDCSYKGNLESHGHSEREVYNYTLALKFENNDNDTVTIYSGYETYSGIINDHDTDNGDKKSVYDFTWNFNDMNRVGDDINYLITSSIRYDFDENEWFILFDSFLENDETGESRDEFCKVYLGDGKTPLGKKANLTAGTVEVIIGA
jgi:hypothetical protein